MFNWILSIKIYSVEEAISKNSFFDFKVFDNLKDKSFTLYFVFYITMAKRKDARFQFIAKIMLTK